MNDRSDTGCKDTPEPYGAFFASKTDQQAHTLAGVTAGLKRALGLWVSCPEHLCTETSPNLAMTIEQLSGLESMAHRFAEQILILASDHWCHHFGIDRNILIGLALC